MLRSIACLLLALPCAALAGVYKCPTAEGGYEYRQIACDAEGAGAVEISDPTVPTSRSKADSGEADASSLQGDWCEFAVSLQPDSEKETSSSTWWYFGSDHITYLTTGAMWPPGKELPKFPLRRAGDAFYVDHDMFAKGTAWRVHGRQDGAILVRGPYGGYLHLRPGRC
jgi:hypothetical protein